MRRFLEREDGFTIQELMVVLVIGSILVGGVWSLYVFAEKFTISWRRSIELKEVVSSTLATISRDILESSESVALTDSSLSLRKHRWGSVVEYAIRGSSVSRNGVSFYQPDGCSLKVRMAVLHREFNREPRILKVTVVGEYRGLIHEQSVLISIPRSAMASYLYDTWFGEDKVEGVGR